MEYFNQLTQIPRNSGEEQGVRDRLYQRGEKHNFTHQTDEAGNVVIKIPATPGYENAETVCIQSHMDMVCLKRDDYIHDFSTDPIQTYEEDGRLKAKGTTLGADNGVGLAMAMAASHIPHPPLELLFTMDEETGLTGAMELNASLISAKLLLNLDTEEEGEICIASAGAVDTNIEKSYNIIPPTLPQYTISLSGGVGGHSGTEIDRPRANVITVFLDAIKSYQGQLELATLGGGKKMNAIPGECKAVLGIDDIAAFSLYMDVYMKATKDSYNDEKSLTWKQEGVKDTSNVIDQDTKQLAQEITTIAVGVHEMHPTIPNFVQTSTNLGTIELSDGLLKLLYMTRGSNAESFDDLAEKIHTHYTSQGYDVQTGNKCPGWSQNPNDPFVQLVAKEYSTVISKDPKIVAVHAGLECGAIAGKYNPTLSAVSIGPDITGAHTPEEKVSLASVERLCAVVEKTLLTIMNK